MSISSEMCKCRLGDGFLNSSKNKNEVCMAAEKTNRVATEKQILGFYFIKGPEGEFYFGRPKQGSVYWEKVELADLIHLGIQGDDIEAMLVNEVYRLVAVSVNIVRGGLLSPV